MKKQNQIGRKNSRGSSRSQGTKRTRVNVSLALKEAVKAVPKRGKRILKASSAKKRAAKARGAASSIVEQITLIATLQTGLPGAIHKKSRSSGAVQVVQTGRFNWKTSEFKKALRQGRFLVTRLNQFHRLAMELEDRWCDYKAFLEVAADAHLLALRGSVPLYWIETHDSQRHVTLISLRGPAPGDYPDDRRSAKDAKSLEREIQYRASESDFTRKHSRRIETLSNKYIHAPRGDTNDEKQLRLLQIAYIAAHTTADEYRDFCNALEAIIEPMETRMPDK